MLAGGKAGVLEPPGDADAFARAVARVLGDPGHAADLGAAARRRATGELSWERVRVLQGSRTGGT
jgi:glycosyltransferase involved in cell wall biosynthesis